MSRLRFAAKDANDFVTLAKAQAGGLYEKVIPYPEHESLRDEDATRDAILDGLEWIMGAVTEHQRRRHGVPFRPRDHHTGSALPFPALRLRHESGHQHHDLLILALQDY